MQSHTNMTVARDGGGTVLWFWGAEGGLSKSPSLLPVALQLPMGLGLAGSAPTERPRGASPVSSHLLSPLLLLCYLYLVGVCVEVEVLQEAGCKLAEEEVMGLVDGPKAPVRVVIGAGAGAEGPHCGVGKAQLKPGREGAARSLLPTGSQDPRQGACPPPSCPAHSRVQSGAVCQCWLSWVKHVRPGMLHVSLFCRRLSSLRSFFFRFCSRSSHTLSFSCSPFLRAHGPYPSHPLPPHLRPSRGQIACTALGIVRVSGGTAQSLPMAGWITTGLWISVPF